MPWLTDWGRRKSHTIDGSTVGAQTNYQKKIVVHKGAGADGGDDVYCGGNCRDDFGDIRFTKADGETELDYWLRHYTSGSEAEFWVEIDTIPGDPDSIDIYVYYDNAAVTTTSSITATWIFGDDFETGDFTRWDSAGAAWSIDSGIYKHGSKSAKATHQDAGRSLYKDIAALVNGRVLFYCRAWYSSYGVLYRWFPFLPADDGSDKYLFLMKDNDFQYYDTDYRDLPTPTTFVFNQWYDVEITFKWGSNTYKVYIDGAYKGEVSTISATDLDRMQSLSGNDANKYDGWLDDFVVGKFVDPEPADGDWGDEELEPTGGLKWGAPRPQGADNLGLPRPGLTKPQGIPS